ncbi:hypothetical protein ENBRE01_3321 [Enteropsectra breve]|nr:hypothetical protein ENBRE01_3321 [Enteropsectra breve]
MEQWMQRNNMEVNVSKTQFMVINPKAKEIELKYKNETLKQVEEYKYLGIALNTQLDQNRIANQRIYRGNEMLEQIKHTLRNDKVPLYYKQMIIKNVLIPQISYGDVLFAGNRKRVYGIQKIIDKALGLALGKPKFSRNRAYEEFDLEPFSIQAELALIRCQIKWRSGRNIINEVILSTNKKDYPKRSKKRERRPTTILQRAEKLLLKRKTNLRKNFIENKIKLKELAGRRGTTYKKNFTNNLGQLLGLGSGKWIRKAQFLHPEMSHDLSYLTRLRCNVIPLTNDYVRMKKISTDYRNKCTMCNGVFTEDILHLTECTVYEFDAVEEYRNLLRTHRQGQSEHHRNACRATIFGGFMKNKDSEIEKRVRTIVPIIKQIISKRNKRIGTLVTAWNEEQTINRSE